MRIQFDGREVDFDDVPPCDFCHGTGEHLCPDVVEPIVIPCSKKGCTFRTVDISKMDLDEEEQ